MKIGTELSDEQKVAWETWKASVIKKKVEEQRGSMDPDEFEILTQGGKYPYSGAIGGAMTWHITHTSIGTIVRCTYWEEELDLTEYNMW